MNSSAPHAQPTPLFNASDFGAIPDGTTDNAPMLQRALDACGAAGGGTVFVGPGVYLTGPISMRSHTVLYLSAGARLLGSPRLEDYRSEGVDAGGESVRAGLVTVHKAVNVAIVGSGEIDGNGFAFVDAGRLHLGSGGESAFTRQKADYGHERFGTADSPLAHGERPGNLIRFFDCRRVRLEGVTISNSPTWTIHFRRCDDVSIRGLTIHSHASGNRVPNDDGIDIADSTRVRIEGCTIDTGDDCIAIFGSREVIVSNCHFRSRSAAVRIGYDLGLTRGCVFSNLTIEAHRGFMVNSRASGCVEDVLISNVVIRTRLMTGGWWGHGEPVQISVLPESEGAEIGHIRGIHIRDLVADAESGIVVHGSSESVIEDVSFENVRLRMHNGPLQQAYGGNFDLRGRVPPAFLIFAHDIPALFFRHVRNLRVDGLEVAWDGNVPDFFSHAIEGEEFDGVEIARFCGRQAHAGSELPAISLKRGSRVVVRDSRAAAGCAAFLGWSDVKGFRNVANNDLNDARIHFDPALPDSALATASRTR
ncbi:MAG TPA: glycosyl hydrolase family 28 protein [Opitutaceae bacterium]|nr:glycosyl hydrolase family 28 protein [Opitutaceae bacterium]